MTSEKGWSCEQVLDEPLARLFVLWTENEISHGAQWAEPSYEERDSMDQIVTMFNEWREGR